MAKQTIRIRRRKNNSGIKAIGVKNTGIKNVNKGAKK